MSVLPAAPPDDPGGQLSVREHLAEVIQLVRPHEHAWSLRDTEYDNGFSLNRFECDTCSAVRFT